MSGAASQLISGEKGGRRDSGMREGRWGGGAGIGGEHW